MCNPEGVTGSERRDTQSKKDAVYFFLSSRPANRAGKTGTERDWPKSGGGWPPFGIDVCVCVVEALHHTHAHSTSLPSPPSSGGQERFWALALLGENGC